MRDYGRLLRTPQWLLRTALAVAAIGLCVVLSYWQYARTQDQLAVARAAVSQLVDYEAALPADADDGVPAEALGRQVRVSGTVVDGARSFVRGRTSPDGEPGFLVVDGVRLGDGRVVAVLQGWVAAPAQAPALAGRSLRLDGRLQPDENFYPAGPKTVTEPLVTITRAGLQLQWSSALAGSTPAPGYVVVTGAPADPGLRTVRPVIGSDPDVSYPWQNVFYSVQWLIFAGVVVLIWFRWLRDDVRDAQAPDEVRAAADDRVSL